MIEEGLGGNVAIVTAAAGMGIGRAVARRLAESGVRVAVTDVHERRCDQVVHQLRGEFPAGVIRGYVLDVGNTQQVDDVVDAVNREIGPIRYLVNNAAVNWPGAVFDYPLKYWHRTIEVNLTGPWYLSRVAMSTMRDHGGGCIVNISSAAADDGGAFGGEGVYAITKGALETMTRSLAADGGPFGIRVNSLSMGIVTGTRFIDQHPEQALRALAHVPLGRHPTTLDVAKAVTFLLSERSRCITGDIVSVNGGYEMRK